MLQDLEARQETSASTTPVYKGLRPVGTGARRSTWRLFAVLASVLGLGVAIYFAAERMGVEFLPANMVTMISPKVSVPVTVAPTSAVPAPVAPPPAAGPVAREEPKSIVLEKIEPPPTLVAANAAVSKVADPKPAAVVSPPAEPRSSESQKKSQVRIVKPTEPAAAPVSKVERVRPVVKAPPPAKSAAVKAPATEQVAVVDKKIRPLTSAEKSEEMYRRAVKLLDQGRPDHAADQLRELLRTQPDHVPARELAAGLVLQGGHWREAQELLEEGLRQVPTHYPFARLLARVYVDHGSEAKALAVMESAAPAGSDDPDFSTLLGVLYQRAGRHTEAVQVYQRALTLRPQDARTWLGFAISLEGVEQWDAAQRAYERAKGSGELTAPLTKYAEQRIAALKNK